MMLQHITLLLLLLVVQTYQHPQEVYLNGAIKRQPLSSKYIINKFSSTNSSGDSTTNATILANLMGDLLIDNMKFPRCWNGSRKGWEKFANYTQSKRPILLEQDAWDSARLATNIFYRLAGEVMGFPVRYMEFTGGYDNVLGPRLQAGAVDVVMEMWITGIPVTWFDHGSVGYQGRSGMYIPTWLAQSDVTLAFDFWRFFQNPKAINTFKTKSWKPIVNNPDGTPICTGILKGCQNNTYHPAWWTPETDQNFVTMWHIDPSWSQYHYERLIDGLGINATITWLGGNNFYNIVGQALKNNTPCVFYQWKPSSFVAVNNVTRLMFPDSDNGLTLKWLIDPVNSPIGQDEATTIITKATPMTFGADFPDVVKLLNLISIAEVEINTLLRNMANNNWTYDVAVCDWMKNNVDEWMRWIPDPPQMITTCGVGLGLYQSNGLPICLVCPPNTYSWTQDSNPCYDCPHDAYCPGGSDVYAATSFWINPANFNNNLTHPDIYSCPYPHTCCEEKSCPPNHSCGPGFTGPLCTSCIQPGYYLWRNTCMDCSNIAPTVIAIVIGSFVATFLLLFVPQHETPTVELLLFYFQVVNLIFGVEITSFDGMVDLEKFLALASLDIDGMTTSCPAPLTGVSKQLFRFVLPFLFFIHAAILYLTAQFLRSWNPALMEKLLMYLPVHSKHISVKVIFLRITQILITFVLMPLVEASLAILDCRSLMGRNVDFQAPDEKCFGPNHMPAAIFAIVMLILLLGVYPTMLVFQLRKLKINNRLKYDVDPDSLTVIDELNLTLYADYRQSYYFMGPILVWEKGVLVLLFKLLLGKVNGIGFTYVAILAVLCFERIYVQPYLFGIEAYMNREIVLCWLILMAINLSTLESGFNQNVGGVITFLLILPAALHICRWAYSAYRGRNPDSMAGGSITDSQSALGGTGSKHGLARKGSAKGNSIENLTGRPKSKKGGSGAGSSTSHTHKNSSSARESNLGTGSIQAAPLQRTNSQMGMRTGSIIKSTALGVTSPVGRASGSGVSTVPAVSGPYGLGTIPPNAGSRNNLELVGEVDSNHVQYDFVEKQVI